MSALPVAPPPSTRSGGVALVHGLVLAVAASALLPGCAADYLNNYETVTLAAGDAKNFNLMLHTNEHFNPNSQVTAIPTDGQRATNAVRTYRAGPGAQASSSSPQAVINITNQGD